MRRAHYDNLVDTEYPAVRLALRDRGINEDDEQLEQTLLRMFPEADPQEVESFMRGLRNFSRQLAPIARTVAPLAQRAGQGALKGGLSGLMTAGPWGAVAGALGGGALSLLSPPQPSPSAVQPAGPGTASQQVAQPTLTAQPIQPAAPVPAPSSVAAGTSPAVAQLLALLSRPETMQALQALLLGAAGRPTVAVGGRQVPTTAFANAIAELAAEALETSERGYAEDYLYADDGSPRCDIANRTEQAALVLADLAVVEANEAADLAEDSFDEWHEDWTDDWPNDDLYDEITAKDEAHYYEEGYP